ncbi:MAG: transcription-repair coupling factor [Oscillospiraceae bacterium]|jgi:transcription-repair coupling factor (superfamily II helicase)|nr:transcription-repair coupling factor [Oscillospiraceae bacterium]
MKFLKNIIRNLPQYNRFKGAVCKKKFPIKISGFSSIHMAHFIYTVCDQSNKALVLAHDESHATMLANDLCAMGCKALVFPWRDFEFRDVLLQSRENEQKRVAVLSSILIGDFDVIVACADAAIKRTIPPKILEKNILKIKEKSKFYMFKLRELLNLWGYSSCEKVKTQGQFSSRGGILDIFANGEDYPVRIEFFGDEVDSICYFEIETQQRKNQRVSEIKIVPATEIIVEDFNDFKAKIRDLILRQLEKERKVCAEILKSELRKLESNETIGSMDKFLPIIYQDNCNLFSYFDDSDFLFVCENSKIKKLLCAQDMMYQEDFKKYLEDGVLIPELSKFSEDYSGLLDYYRKKKTVYLDHFTDSTHGILPNFILEFNASKIESQSGSFDVLCKNLNHFKGYTKVILAGREQFCKFLSKDLSNSGISNLYLNKSSNISQGLTCVMPSGLSSGFFYQEAKFVLLTYKKLSIATNVKKKNVNAKSLINTQELRVGDYVVHSSYGVGIFLGVKKIDTQGIIKDYIRIKYAKGDVLYVPVVQIDMLSKYIGPREFNAVRLNKLGTDAWSKTKYKAKKAAKDIAEKLCVIYSNRIKAKGYAFEKDTESQKDFEAKFEYEETQDQLRCIDEIKEDMQSQFPMDRLLCGDVGFGKTEVALRAAFKCVSNYKQCAIIAPTVILAWQHFLNVVKRFDGFSVKIELLSRLQSKKEQKNILKKLSEGSIDLIIGTHRLIQDDVIFKDLGLLVIDEEQRFGVDQKEKFKGICTNADILSLSATPIPRTLNMAIAKIRDMSIIEQAPQDRQIIKTYVLEYSEVLVKDFIDKEIRRGGQIYYLHNSVKTIEKTALRIGKLLPKARICIGHGKMSEKDLLNAWQRVINRETDIFVCTTIIETGIDVPNVNTLIIEDADKMGLSQLYQIRGRVGRSSRRGYAYFTFKKDKALTSISEKRLDAIKELVKFGSGINIAMRDLELRGAGNILSADQHGHVSDVGYNMYMQLLSNAVKETKNDGVVLDDNLCNINLSINAHISEDYIDTTDNRLSVYRGISNIRCERDAQDIIDDLTDRFGTPPEQINDLIEVALIRSKASQLGVKEIRQKADNIFISFNKPNDQVILNIIKRSKIRIFMDPSKHQTIFFNVSKSSPIKVLNDIFKI